MTIGVDAGALSITDDRLKVGIYRVTQNLLIHLTKRDAENNYRLYTFGEIEQGIRDSLGKNTQVVTLPKLFWQRVWLPAELVRRPVDVFLGLSQSLPSTRSHNIGFIYDLGFLFHPWAYGSSAGKLVRQTEAVIARSDHIVTISHATKRDILARYGISPTQISVCYPGVDARFCPGADSYRTPRPYLLFVGSLNKAKDIPFTLRAFALFLRRTGLAYDFYLIGGDCWPDPEIRKIVEELGLQDRVKFFGFVSDRVLPQYYRGARAFVTSALREGFCLPAAESMACGTPVVSLDRGAMAEVVGEGGVVVRDSTVESFADAMSSLVHRDSDGKRLGQKSIARAKDFSWPGFAQSVRTLIHAYER